MTPTPHRLIPVLLATAVSVATAAGPTFPPLIVEPVDPLIKVFHNDLIPIGGNAQTNAHADAARGEHATFQLAVTSSPVALRNLRCQVSPFALVDKLTDETDAPATTDTDTTSTVSPLPAPRVRFVGYVGSSISASTTASDQLRPAPATYPDPLLEQDTIDVDAARNQPMWISMKVPETAQPGDYASTAVVTASRLGVETSASIPLTLKVYPATITDTRLDVTLWYQMWNHDDWKMPERYTDAWFDIIRGYVRSMVDHRQNWGWIETQAAVKFSRDNAGKLQADFTNFDKWMDMLFEGGLEMIEGQHFAFRTAGWRSDFGVTVYKPGTDGAAEWKPEKVAPDSPEADDFYAAYFPQLQSHLEEKGWLDKYVQHVADEPLDANADSYTTAAALLKKYAPKLRIMEACQSQKMVGTVDIWIPQLDHFHKGHDFFQERLAAGDDVWFYTCMYPAGEYANRFVELPLIKTRLLHWINYRYGATGYLHWGYNFWPPHVWHDTADYRQAMLPGGDANIVYPKPGGPGVLDSIRYEAMRDGIEDHELLSQLGEKDPEAAARLVRRHILDYDKYETDVESFRTTRRELLEALSKPPQ